MLEDHLPSPALQRWLPAWVGPDARAWISPDLKPRGALRRLLGTWAAVADDEASVPALVLATPLGSDAIARLPESLLRRVPVGGRIVELATVEPLTLVTLWRPLSRRRRAVHAVAERIRQWADLGSVDLEQWIALEPANVVVTLGRQGCR